MPGLSKYVEAKEVKTARLPELQRKHKINHVDLLVVDTEGYDYEVLKQVDMIKNPPDMIYMEHMHLLCEDQTKAWSMLASGGYVVTHDWRNTFAYREERELAVLESRS